MSKVMGVTMAWLEELRRANRIFDVEFNDDGEVVKVFVEEYRESVAVDGRALASWREMGDAVRNSRVLKAIELDLNWFDIPTGALEPLLWAVFGSERAHRGPMELLSLSASSIGPGGMAAVIPFLKTTPAIREVYIFGRFGDEETRLLSEGLNHMRIDTLNLCGNNIGDEGLENLLLADNSRHLQELDLWNNRIASRGYDAISRFLARGDTKMKSFFFDDSWVIGETGMLVESINPKSKLTDIGTQALPSNPQPSEEALTTLPQVLRKTVCDSNSIESLCNSNHWLTHVGVQTYILVARDPMLKKALRINAQPECEASEIARCRSKLRAFYFRGQFDTRPFACMDIGLMPHVLELVTMSECFRCAKSKRMGGWDEAELVDRGNFVTVPQGDLGSIYWLLRNWRMHDLFGSLH